MSLRGLVADEVDEGPACGRNGALALASLPPRTRAWEMARYQAYQEQLAGRTIGEIFRRAATFLTLTATCAGSAAGRVGAGATNGPG